LQKQDAEASKQQRQYNLLNKQKQFCSKHTSYYVCEHVFGEPSIWMYMACLVFSDEYENCPVCNDGRTEIISFLQYCYSVLTYGYCNYILYY
jgi:hypothetical protein